VFPKKKRQPRNIVNRFENPPEHSKAIILFFWGGNSKGKETAQLRDRQASRLRIVTKIWESRMNIGLASINGPLNA
jgi:hypothetical protein